MAKQKPARQIWWPLAVLALIMIGLVFLAHRVAPSPGWRTFLDVGIVIFGYGLMALWLETHNTALLDQPSAEADSPADQSPHLEEIPPPLSAHVRYSFYVGSDPAIIYGEPEQANINLSLNGHHHLAKTTPALPEEAAE